jgi:hypothetical protein
MSQLTRAPSHPSGTESDQPANASACRECGPILITEQQVAFSTAAAISGRRVRLGAAPATRFWRTLCAWAQPRPHCPRCEPVYFQTARMSRAMERL